MITATLQLGLTGFPLNHSLSPKIHSAALQACRLGGNYSLFPVHPDDIAGLQDLLSRFRSGEIHGLNVTIPHKQNVMRFLDELTPTARAIGAVNTIYLRENKLTGDNTDAAGFLKDLHRFLSDHQSPTPQISKSAIVLGSGGSARAVVYALVKDDWEVTIAARRIEQAQQLAGSFADQHLNTVDISLSNIELSKISLVVNTTPIGMTPNLDQSPWPGNMPFPPHAAIYDLVYNPRQTQLVKESGLQGLSATTGLGMLIEQAALAFEIWTGQLPPREVMSAAVDAAVH